jgi:predicted secreted protein
VEPKEGEPLRVGAGGKEFWNFKALKKGTSVLSMEYSRPWVGGEKGVNKFSLTVIVE